MNTRFCFRWDFVGNSLKISWQYLWQSLLPNLLPHFLMKKNRWHFVKDFVVSTPIWRNVDNFLTKFWQNFPCGKRCCHNLLPPKKIVKMLSKISLLQLMFQRNVNEFLTKEFVAKSWRFATKHPTKRPTKFWRNSDERKTMVLNARSPYTKKYCKW